MDIEEKINEMTLGSLFDGIGGFPFAATIVGIKPIWASEIDPACIAVTKNRFPDMEHLGSITDIDGAKIPPVDVITFGSPCQDLSVAGKQVGLDGERSGLFKEAIRIIYEMRSATNGKYPSFIIWENVPGAFSSNNGRDFRTVLEEITKTDIPMPSSGKWATAGVVRGGAICAAWRQLDAQYWGVPQRRKRIYLVGSFGSDRAEKILFECDSVRGYLAPCGTVRERTAATTEGSVNISSECFDARENGDGGVIPTMTGDHNGRVNDYCAVVVQAKGFNGQNSVTAGDVEMREELSPTITCKKQADVLYAAGFKGGAGAKAGGIGFEEEKSPTLMSTPSGTNATPTVIVGKTVVFDETQITSPQNGNNPKPNGPCHPLAATAKPPVLCIQGKSIGRADKNAPNGSGINEGVSFTLNTVDQHAVAYACDYASFNQGKNALYAPDVNDSGINSTLVAKGPSAVVYKFIKWIVRRLTPLECERLQGYPDDWTKLPKIDDMTEEEFSFFLQIFLLDKAARGKKTRVPTKASLVKWYNKLDCDGNRYKMCGNSLAIPCALRVLGGIAENGVFNNGGCRQRISIKEKGCHKDSHKTN